MKKTILWMCALLLLSAGAAVAAERAPKRLKGSGRMVTRDWGAAGAYRALSVGSFFRVTVSPEARSITVTADDNVIDYLSFERRGGELRFRFDPGRTKSTEKISVEVVVPASDALETVSVSGFGSVECRTPLRGSSVAVNVSSNGFVRADADAGRMELDVSGFGKFDGAIRCGECRLHVSSNGFVRAETDARMLALDVSGYGKYGGAIRCGECRLHVSSNSRVSCDVACKGLCRLTADGYGQFSGAVAADVIEAMLSSSSSVGRSLTAATRLDLTASGFARYEGGLTAGTAALDVSSSASVAGPFDARSFRATVSGFGKLSLRGDAEVDRGTVTVSSSGRFAAPALRVKEYTVTASSFARAEVWCSELLRIETSSDGRVSYDGPCRVEAVTENVRRRQ